MGDVAQLINDLTGKLPRRSKDERRRTPCVDPDAVDDRDTECERLARSGRRLSEDITAGQDVRDNEPLDSKGLRDSTLAKRLDDWFGRAEIGEGLH
jgi:hypothetical protein